MISGQRSQPGQLKGGKLKVLQALQVLTVFFHWTVGMRNDKCQGFPGIWQPGPVTHFKRITPDH